MVTQINNEEVVYRKITNAIAKRYIKQGSKLVETALAKQLQVSRTPVRGAIRRLAYEGFARYEHNKGVYIIEPTLQEIEETFFVRRQLEITAAKLAARYASKNQIKQLKDFLSKERQTFQDRNLDEYYKVNDGIHLLIAKATGNRVLVRYIKDLLNRTKIYLILYDPFYTMSVNPSLDEHRQVVDALEKRKSHQAGKAMEAHLKSALEGMDVKPPPEDYISV